MSGRFEGKCLICGGATETGFVLDRGESNRRRVGEWWEGRPQRSFFTGLKKPKRRMTIETIRCKKCGYLMEFANPDGARET